MRKLLLLGVFGFAMAGCNTIEGVGKDIESAGGAVAESAEKTKEEIENN